MTRQHLQTSEVDQILGKNKKGQLDPLTALFFIFSNPFVLLGLAIFIIIILIFGYFALGKMVATLFVVFGAIGLFTRRLPLTIALVLVGIGLVIYWNPGDLLNLSALALN